jgi:hypothetical protein
MATLTINTTAGEDARIVAAFGTALNLGRNATLSEVKSAVISYVIRVVREEEAEAAARAAQAASGISPT